MNFIDIFSGIGGFRNGLEKSGHNCIGHIEIDKYANISYMAMYNLKYCKYNKIIDKCILKNKDVYKNNDLNINNSQNKLLYFKIRKLTPKECWRLQGFHDSLFYKAQNTGLSDTQLYKQAGNAVTVNIVYEIGKKLYFIDNRGAWFA